MILVHGGAGTIPQEWEQPKHIGMKAAVRAGYRTLAETDSVLDAVEAAIKVLEDDEAFNAGRGSKLNIFGHIEMDASIMEGASMKAGAVASIGGIRHPIEAARSIMENTSHVLMVGEGAERIAKKFGAEQVDEEWLITDYRQAMICKNGKSSKASSPIPS